MILMIVLILWLYNIIDWRISRKNGGVTADRICTRIESKENSDAIIRVMALKNKMYFLQRNVPKIGDRIIKIKSIGN